MGDNRQEDIVKQLFYLMSFLMMVFVTGVHGDDSRMPETPVDDSLRAEEDRKLRMIGIEPGIIDTKFDYMDADNNSYISKKEADDHNALGYFSTIDVNGDDKVRSEEFAQFMRKYPYVIKLQKEAE